MYAVFPDLQTSTEPQTLPSMRPIRGDGWTRGEVQLMGLAGIVTVIIVLFFGIYILNCFGRLRHRRQRMREKKRKAPMFMAPTPLQVQIVRGNDAVFW